MTGKAKVAELSRKHRWKDSLIYEWRREAIDKLPLVFTQRSAEQTTDARIEELERLIGQQAIELDALKKASKWLILRLRSGERRTQTTDREQVGDDPRRRGGDVSTDGLADKQLRLQRSWADQ